VPPEVSCQRPRQAIASRSESKPLNQSATVSGMAMQGKKIGKVRTEVQIAVCRFFAMRRTTIRVRNGWPVEMTVPVDDAFGLV